MKRVVYLTMVACLALGFAAVSGCVVVPRHGYHGHDHGYHGHDHGRDHDRYHHHH